MSHPLIAVTAPVRDSDIGMPRVVLEAGYLQAVRVAGGLPLVLSALDDENTRERMFRLASGLILTGGEDVDPARYGQAPDGARTVSPERDVMELALLERALESRTPVLAICRGIQILNVALGGTLFQDLYTQRGQEIDHDRYREFDGHIHSIRTRTPLLLAEVFKLEEFIQNSAHHQGVRDLSPELTAVAWAPDGLVEAVEYRADQKAWTCGVQWHPERKIEEATGTNRRLFEVFGAEVRRAASLGAGE
ncbi:MAG: gamma-glutamyl-gamma-aminobutyrate hydrolase family protein [Gemmatimonadetes bacterium]|nr:gamma-glutamyl-gamma-aminobutyrate hydrolase family protein [Gemmatimonadota bacterium]NNK49510.1 gamma-glutamyl-gamma-aminobutyrate hydrolase family protein [Gemmatimonadota bacterium]